MMISKIRSGDYFVTLTGNANQWRPGGLIQSFAYAINTLNAYNDPRLPIYIFVQSAQVLMSVMFWAARIIFPEKVLLPVGPGLLQDLSSQTAVILSAAESHFLQAEAIVRGYLQG